MAYEGINNKTPFQTEMAILADEKGHYQLVVLVKATYTIVGQDSLSVAEEQIPISFAGEYTGEPGQSSLKLAPEGNFIKVATDISLIGSAITPTDQAVPQLDVYLRVGPVEKTLRVFGDREWQFIHDQTGLLQAQISEPQPFTSMPLVYENAFGGKDLTPEKEEDHEFDSRNPLGKGLIANNSRHEDFVQLPNIEDPNQLISSYTDRPPPAGFGPIPADWEPRLSLAGTYDENWKNTRMPLLPVDFDRRFLSSAHPDLIADGFLVGDESVDIINVSVRGPIRFNLPAIRPCLKIKTVYAPRLVPEVQLDSVILDTDEHNIQLLWRASCDIHNRVQELQKIEIDIEGAISRRPTGAAA